jgi:hypothetical protein
MMPWMIGIAAAVHPPLRVDAECPQKDHRRHREHSNDPAALEVLNLASGFLIFLGYIMDSLDE